MHFLYDLKIKIHFLFNLDEMILSNPEANSPVREDHPLNPNPNSSWQNFFKVIPSKTELNKS